MSRNKKKSEASSLEAYRVALINASAQEQISKAMLELGYDEAVLTQGRNILDETLEKYQLNKLEDAERSDSYDSFESLWEDLSNIYNLDRKKAKVIFRNEPAILEKIGVYGQIPKAFVNWIQTVKKFYNEISGDSELQKRVLRLKITTENVQLAIELIGKLEMARADYIREKGESQDATQMKDKAFAKVDDWMSEFYAVARIALEDNPQLLEALSKTVKA